MKAESSVQEPLLRVFASKVIVRKSSFVCTGSSWRMEVECASERHKEKRKKEPEMSGGFRGEREREAAVLPTHSRFTRHPRLLDRLFAASLHRFITTRRRAPGRSEIESIRSDEF
jgi:hypothetical protein